MASRRIDHVGLCALMAIAVICVAPSVSNAITINLFGTGANQPDSAIGGGSLMDIARTAADAWENVFLDDHTLNITIKWGPLPSNTIALHEAGAFSGNPVRQASATITFDNDSSRAWFLDPTPNLNEEWSNFFSEERDLGGGIINIRNTYTGYRGPRINPGNLTPFDLFSVAIHEIGHALGLSSANPAYHAESWPDNEINITAPLPFAGSVIPTNNAQTPANSSSSNAHFSSAILPHTLMVSGLPQGIRRLQTHADILANAQLSQFRNINLNPLQVIPAPSTGILALTGLVFAALPRGIKRNLAA